MGILALEKMSDRPQDTFNGTWNEVSNSNIEGILKKLGYNWAIRKVALAMGMTLVIKGTDDGMFISMQTILKNSDENLYFDRVRETFGLTRSEKITISPLKIDGNKHTIISSVENSGKHTCDIHVVYEKKSDTELKMTNTIDDVIAVREFKKAAE